MNTGLFKSPSLGHVGLSLVIMLLVGLPTLLITGNGVWGSFAGAQAASWFYIARELEQAHPHWGLKTFKPDFTKKEFGRALRQAGYPILVTHFIVFLFWFTYVFNAL
jgi:hypothetical protein